MLFSSFCQAWVPTRGSQPWPGHMTGAHHFLSKMNSELGNASYRAEQYLWMQRAWSTLRGKLLPKSIFYKYKPFILIMSLYLYQCFIISIK